MADSRRRLGAEIIGGVLAVCLLVVLVAVVFRQPEADGYGPEVESRVVGFCARSAPDVELDPHAPGGVAPETDDPTDACRCAYQRLVATVPWDRFVEMDEALRSGGAETPPELTAAVRACGAVPG